MASGSVSFLGRLLDGDGMVVGLAWSPDLKANLFFLPPALPTGAVRHTAPEQVAVAG
jgi:hypothetical protein